MKKKLLALLMCAILSVGFLTGCGKEESSTSSNTSSTNGGSTENGKENSNTSSEDIASKMFDGVKNYSYDVTMSISGMDSVMKCKDDRENKIIYCSQSVLGTETEQYLDYENGYNYQKVSSSIVSYDNAGEWEKEKAYGFENSGNSYANIASFAKNLSKEEKNGGTYYTGKVDSSSITDAMASTGVDYSDLISGDIDVEFFVNSDGRIETMNYTLTIMSMTADVKIKFHDFNTTGSIELPEI